MRVVILAGGKGSRLRPYTVTIPKPLVPIGDLPILEILIRQLRHQGCQRITISVGHLASLIQAFCGYGERWQVPIDYVFEEQPLGTIGCLAMLDDLGADDPGPDGVIADDDRVLVVNGDTLTDLDMAAAWARHSPADAISVLAKRRAVEIDFGVLETAGDDRLTAYLEKPTHSYRVSIGVNVISRWAVRRFIARGERLDLPELVRRVLAAGETVRVVETDAFWLDLGRLGDLDAGTAAFASDPRRFLPP